MTPARQGAVPESTASELPAVSPGASDLSRGDDEPFWKWIDRLHRECEARTVDVAMARRMFLPDPTVNRLTRSMCEADAEWQSAMDKLRRMTK